MTYASEEASQQSSVPIELYKFESDVDSYYLTSAQEDITYFTTTYFAVPIKRTDVGTQQDAQWEITVSLPVSTQLAQNYIFAVPPARMYCTIIRLQGDTLSNSATLWEGPVAGWNVKERLVNLRIPNEMKARVNEEIPKGRYQVFCNNILFDGICTVPRAGFNVVTTVSTISTNGKSLVLPSIGGNPDGWADGGEIVHNTTGERIMILTQVGTSLTILRPFSSNFTPGDAVTVYAGCDHSLDHCVNKFSNVDNFNGFPFLISQALNPTQGGV